MTMKVSVIVPVYNTEKYLEKCITSLVNQTYKELEIILVNDGSTDKSAEICDSFLQDDRVVVIHKKNGGLVSARKAGLRSATGDYVTFVDSDDWMEIDAYEKIIGGMEGKKADIVLYGLKKIYEDTFIDRYERFEQGFYTKEMVKEAIDNFYYDDNVAFINAFSYSLCTKLVKKSLLERNMLALDNRIIKGEDLSVVIPMLIEADTIVVEKYNPYNYRVRLDSMSHSCDEKNCCKYELVETRISQCLANNNINSNQGYYKMAQTGLLFLKLTSNVIDYYDSLSSIYKGIEEKSKILIYGKGIYGNNIKELILKERKYTLVGMIDKYSLCKINDYQYDYIVVAMAVGEYVLDALKLLKDLGVSSERIKYIRNRDVWRNNISD